MEGRKPTGVLGVMVNNKEPSKEDEFNKWYNETHIPDIVGTGIYYKGAFMFEVTGHLSTEHVKQFGGFDGLADKVCKALNEEEANSK